MEHCDGKENITAYKLENGTLKLIGKVSGGLLSGHMAFSVDGRYLYATQTEGAPVLGTLDNVNALLIF